MNSIPNHANHSNVCAGMMTLGSSDDEEYVEHNDVSLVEISINLPCRAIFLGRSSI